MVKYCNKQALYIFSLLYVLSSLDKILTGGVHEQCLTLSARTLWVQQQIKYIHQCYINIYLNAIQYEYT